ncbi:MAG TPA: hypothetical protein VMH81_30875 [Bryobacteraceae bacterium]|nr:hypothetical protein [Bryobacteraceae bacterium]
MPGNAGFRRRLLVGSLPMAAMLLILSAGWNYHWARVAFDREAHNGLDRDWVAMKGYLRIERDPERDVVDRWYYDADDPDESAAVSRIQEQCFIADSNGRVLRASPFFHDRAAASLVRTGIGVPLTSADSARPVWIIASDAHGARYLIRAGIVMDGLQRSSFYVALAEPLMAGGIRLLPFGISLAGAILAAIALGYFGARVIHLSDRRL